MCLIPSRLIAAAALLATMLFGFSPPSLAARGAEPAQLNLADNPVQAASQLFTTTTSGGPLAPRKVAISSFSVEYMLQNSATASATEIGRSGSANSGLYYKLVGLSDADLQALTDQLFTEFQRELVTAGFEVVPADTVRAAAAYRRLAAGGKPSPMDKSENRSEYRVVAPTGMALWGLSAASGGLLAGFTGAAQVLGSLGDSIELQKELGRHPPHRTAQAGLRHLEQQQLELLRPHLGLGRGQGQDPTHADDGPAQLAERHGRGRGVLEAATDPAR